MAWVQFKTEFTFRPTDRISVRYRTDKRYNVPRECVAQAVAAGAIDPSESPADADTSHDPEQGAAGAEAPADAGRHQGADQAGDGGAGG